MKVEGLLMIGFLSIVVTTGAMNVSDSFASDVKRMDVPDRMGHGGSIYQQKPIAASDCHVVGEERIGQGGSAYRLKSAQAGDCTMAGQTWKKIDVAKRIGHGGSLYFSTQTMNN